MHSVNFKIKTTVGIDKHRILEILFKEWIDNICDTRSKYKTTSGTWLPDVVYADTHLNVICDSDEDATIVKLAGVPKALDNYLEIDFNTQ